MFRIISSQYNNLKVEISDFNPYHTFLCGQCFRWNVNEDGIWTGIILIRRKTCFRRENMYVSEYE